MNINKFWLFFLMANPLIAYADSDINNEVEAVSNCLAENIDIVYEGQTGFADGYMELKITNNTNIPFSWLSAKILEKDGRYDNLLDENEINLSLDYTLAPGETTSGGWYGDIREGRKVEVVALNIRDLEGKRLVDDNTNYIGSPYPTEISTVKCEAFEG